MSDKGDLPSTVVVGRIRKPHGVRGEVSVEVLSDVEGRLAVGQRLVVRPRGGDVKSVEVISARSHGDLRILRFDASASRDDVEPLRGAMLEADRATVPEAPDGTFYYYELAGCAVVDATAGDLGQVIDVVEDGGGWLLEIEGRAGRLLVPFVDAYLAAVNIEHRRIEVDLPEGLIKLCTSTS